MSKQSNIIIIILVVLMLAIAGIGIYFYLDAKEKTADLQEIEEMMTIEKERVADEYEDLTTQFDGYTTTIKNDSLLKQLENEKNRVQELLKELKDTRATNARRIQELRDELASVRKIMTNLIYQIDSLNTENQFLKSENSEIKMKYEEKSQTVDQLSKEKENLNEIVTRASKMEVVSCELTTLTDKNKKTGLFSRIANLQFSYTIAKNVTVKPGHKVMFLRITKPDGALIKKSGQEFKFEDQMIAYSTKKEYSFGGETMDDVMYWKVDETLLVGTYLAEFFTDGYLVGSFNFKIKR